jgi:hypothetical protein
MIQNAKDYVEPVSFETTICIVGGGVAGITLALELSSEFSVILLEAGDEVYTAESQDYYKSAEENKLYPNTSISRLRFLGGSSNHWANNTSPLDPIDFEKRSWISNSGWPISFDDISPFYEEAAKYCGTGTDGYDSDYWHTKTKFSDITKGSAVLLSSIAKAASPPTRFFNTYGDQLKRSTTITVIKNANLIDLIVPNPYEKVKSAIFTSYSNSNLKHKVNAQIFVFAMGGIENARMMLHVNRKYNNQIGNQFDNVGRYFMDHPLPRAASLFPRDSSLFEFFQGVNYKNRRVISFLNLSRDALVKNETINLRLPLARSTNYFLSDGISSFHILSHAISKAEYPDNFGTHISNILNDIDMVAEAASRELFNKQLFDDANNFGGYVFPMTMEQLPDYSNRVYLSNEEDSFGIPKIKIDWEIKTENKEMMWKTLKIVAIAVGSLSIGRMKLFREREERLWSDGQLGFGHHHMGTTRMSYSQKDGVVDSNQKVFGMNNLYIAGSSVFTTGGHVPPTLTITALSIRLSRILKGVINA